MVDITGVIATKLVADTAFAVVESIANGVNWRNIQKYMRHKCGREYNIGDFRGKTSIQCGRCGETVYNIFLRKAKEEEIIVLPPKPKPVLKERHIVPEKIIDKSETPEIRLPPIAKPIQPVVVPPKPVIKEVELPPIKPAEPVNTQRDILLDNFPGKKPTTITEKISNLFFGSGDTSFFPIVVDWDKGYKRMKIE